MTQTRIVVPAYGLVLVEREPKLPPRDAEVVMGPMRSVKWSTSQSKLSPPNRYECEVVEVPVGVPWNVNQMLMLAFPDASMLVVYGWLAAKSPTAVEVILSNFDLDGCEHGPEFVRPPTQPEEITSQLVESRRRVEAALGIAHGCVVCGCECDYEVCEEHCPDHEYKYDMMEQAHLCRVCGKRRPEDWCDE